MISVDSIYYHLILLTCIITEVDYGIGTRIVINHVNHVLADIIRNNYPKASIRTGFSRQKGVL